MSSVTAGTSYQQYLVSFPIQVIENVSHRHAYVDDSAVQKQGGEVGWRCFWFVFTIRGPRIRASR